MLPWHRFQLKILEVDYDADNAKSFSQFYAWIFVAVNNSRLHALKFELGPANENEQKWALMADVSIWFWLYCQLCNNI